MTSAIEKLADPEPPSRRRHIVCHRCSIECSVPRDVPLDAVACIGCLRRLGAPPLREGEPPHAITMLADWWDKAAAPGPGYGAVQCPHCGATCVVEVGGAARTGCGVCLRPLGSSPLIRTDLAMRRGAERRVDGRGFDDRRPFEDTCVDAEPWAARAPLLGSSCLFFPGEQS